MKRNIDELLKQKYNEIEYGDNMAFEIKNKKRNNNLYKVASIVLLIIAVATITVVSYEPKKEVANNNVTDKNIILENELVSAEIVPTHQITIGSKDITPYASYYIAGTEDMYVLAIRVNKILGYTNYSEKQDKYSLPVTKFEAEVLKCFKGELNGNIEIYTSGGIVSLANWEKTLNDTQKEKQGYNDMTQEYKENTYVEIYTSINLDRDKLENGKVYLVCLSQDSYFYEGLVATGPYALKEFDMSKNSIKQNGKWTDINDIKRLNEIIK